MTSLVLLAISNTKSDFTSERRYDRNVAVADLKSKLELVTGVVSQFMELELYNVENKLVSRLDDDKMLGYYSPQNGFRLHVIDKNPNSQKGEFDDVSKVEKYELSNEEYDRKQDSVRNFMKKNKIGKYSEDAKQAEEKLKQKEANEENLAKTYTVGARCQTSVPKQPKRRGVIMFIGEVEFQPGCWVGVKYDEPLGKNDGSVKGKRYFTCEPKYGGFVRPSQVEVGDFPEEDFGLDDDEDEM